MEEGRKRSMQEKRMKRRRDWRFSDCKKRIEQVCFHFVISLSFRSRSTILREKDVEKARKRQDRDLRKKNG